MLCEEYTEAETGPAFYCTYFRMCPEAFSPHTMNHVYFCKYSFIDFINFCLVSLFQTISTMLPFLSFLLDFCESWSLAEEEEQGGHHEATLCARLQKRWVSRVRRKSPASYFTFLCPGLQTRQDCHGRDSKPENTNCHVFWQLECRFNVWGRLHLREMITLLLQVKAPPASHLNTLRKVPKMKGVLLRCFTSHVP